MKLYARTHTDTHRTSDRPNYDPVRLPNSQQWVQARVCKTVIGGQLADALCTKKKYAHALRRPEAATVQEKSAAYSEFWKIKFSQCHAAKLSQWLTYWHLELHKNINGRTSQIWLQSFDSWGSFSHGSIQRCVLHCMTLNCNYAFLFLLTIESSRYRLYIYINGLVGYLNVFSVAWFQWSVHVLTLLWRVKCLCVF